jgi:hypothetical protein
LEENSLIKNYFHLKAIFVPNKKEDKIFVAKTFQLIMNFLLVNILNFLEE